MYEFAHVEIEINLSNFISIINYHTKILQFFTIATKEFNTKLTKFTRSKFIKIRQIFRIAKFMLSQLMLSQNFDKPINVTWGIQRLVVPFRVFKRQVHFL